MSKFQKNYVTIVLAIIIIIAISIVVYTNLPQNNTDDQSEDDEGHSDDDVQNDNNDIEYLSLIYNNETYSYTLQDLQNFDTITGYGGYRTNFPSIKGQGNYTGVIVSSLVKLTAGSINNYSLAIASNESGIIETQTFNYSVIQGLVDIYKADNISSPIGKGNVTMILAYKFNGEYLNEDENGKLRIGFINNDEERITPAYLWWKFVESIEIIE